LLKTLPFFNFPADEIRRVLVEASEKATQTLNATGVQDVSLMRHATKQDVLGFDYRLQSVLVMEIKKGLHRVAGEFGVSFLVSLLGGRSRSMY
jgi:hypothetical protein